VCLAGDACLAPRQVDDRNVMATRRVACQGAPQPDSGSSGCPPTQTTFGLREGAGEPLTKSGSNRRGNGQETFSAGHMGYGYHSAYSVAALVPSAIRVLVSRADQCCKRRTSMPTILPKTVQIAILRRDGWLCSWLVAVKELT